MWAWITICVSIIIFSSILIFLIIIGQYPQANRDHGMEFKTYLEVQKEYSRLTDLVFKFYKKDPAVQLKKYSKEYSMFEKILDLQYPYIHKEKRLSESINMMEEKSKKVFELYRHIIPELKMENRDRNLEEILSS